MKIGTPLTRAQGKVCASFDFCMFFFVCELHARTRQTDGRTDRRTDKSRNAAYRTAAQKWTINAEQIAVYLRLRI